MDLVVYGSEGGDLTYICTCEDVPVSEGLLL